MATNQPRNPMLKSSDVDIQYKTEKIQDNALIPYDIKLTVSKRTKFVERDTFSISQKLSEVKKYSNESDSESNDLKPFSRSYFATENLHF